MTGIADDSLSAGQRLARTIRAARASKGWTQEDLVAESGVSAPTIKRWESGKSDRPEPDLLRAVFHVLEIDMREAAVILGYITREELGLPPEPPRRFSANIERVIEFLVSDDVPEAEKRDWMAYLEFRRQRLGIEPEEERPARRRAAG